MFHTVTKSKRGAAMFELVMLMMATAYVMHLFLHWSFRFSKSESYWAGALQEAHQKVAHQICLETIEMNPRNHLYVIAKEEPICSDL